jgi:hypothetical protein
LGIVGLRSVLDSIDDRLLNAAHAWDPAAVLSPRRPPRREVAHHRIRSTETWRSRARGLLFAAEANAPLPCPYAGPNALKR